MIQVMTRGGMETTKTSTDRRAVRLQLSKADRTVFHPASLRFGRTTRLAYLS